MRKSILLLAALFIISANALAVDMGNYGLTTAFDFNAPVIYNKTNFVTATAGQIVFDGANQAFYGLPPNTDPSVAGNWLQLGGGVVSGNPVLSVTGSNVRVATARIDTACTSSPCTLSDQTGGWIDNGTVGQFVRNSAGSYTLTIVSGTFSAAPTCTISAVNTSSGNVTFCIANAGTGVIGVNCATGPNTLFDAPFAINCIGPQ